MPEHRVSFPRGAPLSAVLSDMPQPLKRSLQAGFVALAGLTPQKVDLLAASAPQFITQPRPQYHKELAAKLEIDERAADALLLAAGFLASLFSARPSTAGEILDAIKEAALVEPDSQPAVEDFAQRLTAQKEELAAVQRRAELSNETLPSFGGLNLSLDVRLDFDDDQVAVAVPLAVAALYTDAENQIVWFQMTKEQVEEVQRDFETLHKRMIQAEQLSGALVRKSK